MAQANTRQRTGFTLVELLVVIAILSALIAMLLPAVNMAREAARRTQCKNNLKQIGIGLKSYESSNNAFPSGARSHMPNDSSAANFGFSWHVAILPFMEELPLYNNLDLIGEHASNQVGFVDKNTTNGNMVAGYLIPYLDCPSSPMDAFVLKNTGVPGAAGVMAPCYTGISGSSQHYTAVNKDGGNGTTQARGIVSSGGVLPAHLFVSAARVQDGLSKTIMVGEQSDYLYDSSGNPVDSRSDGGQGFMAGAAAQQSSDLRQFNVTVVRYPINSENASLIGVTTPGGANRPIISPHSSSAHVLFADGRVTLLPSSTSEQVLYNFADKDDGNPTPSL